MSRQSLIDDVAMVLPPRKPDDNGVTVVADGAVPVPARRPGRAAARVVGRVEDGKAVPLSPSAFAARAAVNPADGAFAAAEAAVTPTAAVPESPAAPAPVAPAPAMIAGHNRAAAVKTDEAAFTRYGRQSSSLAGALDALKADRYEEAIKRRNGLSDPLDRKIVDYFLVRSPSHTVTSAMVADFALRAPDWMDIESVRARSEEALSRERPGPDAVIRSMKGAAQSPAGVRLLANAMLAKGDKARARALVIEIWRTRAMGESLQMSFAQDFGSFLTVDDHLDRIDRLVGLHRFSEARALKARLGTGPRVYVDARIAVAEGAGNAKSLLGQVPSDLRRRPGYRLAEVEQLRRQDAFDKAARLIESVPRRDIVDGDDWWVETRIIARSLAERGDQREAYKLTALGFAKGAEERADEAFHAGWFAMKLNDGRAADRHFATLEQIATTPISLSRAGYWRGRAAKLRRDDGAARQHFNAAARYGFTYYGQLSRNELGLSGTGVGRAPTPSATDRTAIRNNEMAEAVTRLMAAGHEHRIYPLLDQLSETVPTAGQLVLTAELARKAGYPHLALMVAKEGQRRGLDVGHLAFPTSEIPRDAKIPSGLDRALVYSIARQESLFNAGAVSPVGARGLMQVMPNTASMLAREMGLPHSVSRLTTDPGYNASLGAAYLHKRLSQYNGSYILTFAAYNAGASRVAEWIERFGDPRDPRVDPIAWVEQIPYPETRNYVQRVMENIQVYREALGTGRLAIEVDLQRGRSS
ncbi:lytic transglycosylase domain-containing protein [Acuticoccus kandeliae]|uniref:lytic transglycosylase domain-containing protein n=1 Tax=Acuticoccus kandeliae TaxID=2073160 RepID=UPI0013002DB0|nr:lytic transglycosylase domain-containing protein [Acuticoccus kandeliae]